MRYRTWIYDITATVFDDDGDFKKVDWMHTEEETEDNPISEDDFCEKCIGLFLEEYGLDELPSDADYGPSVDEWEFEDDDPYLRHGVSRYDF